MDILNMSFMYLEKANMIAKIQGWGNSQGVRLHKQILEIAHLHTGDEVEVTAVEGKIIIETVSRVRGRVDLKKLVDKMPKDYEPQEENWNDPMGKEVW